MRQPEVNIAVKAAWKAGNVLLRLQKQVQTMPVTQKRENDFASVADKAAEEVIIETLKQAFPDHAIMAEESGFHGDSEYVWIIDPLDGTTNFLHGFPHYSISLALQHNGVIEHGVVFDPVRDETFYASRGKGAFVNDQRIRVNQKQKLDGALLATGFPFRNRQLFNRYMRQFKTLFKHASDVRRAGSAALDLAYVAASRVDGFWEMGLEPWDMAAGSLLVTEAGGQCLDFKAGQDFLKSGNIIAGNLQLVAEIYKKIHQLESDPAA